MKTTTQRYNDKMQKTFDKAIESLQKYCKHSYHLVQDSFSMQKECGKCGKKAKVLKYKMAI